MVYYTKSTLMYTSFSGKTLYWTPITTDPLNLWNWIHTTKEDNYIAYSIIIHTNTWSQTTASWESNDREPTLIWHIHKRRHCTQYIAFMLPILLITQSKNNTRAQILQLKWVHTIYIHQGSGFNSCAWQPLLLSILAMYM